MKIIMKQGDYQVEDWRENYPNLAHPFTVGCYPTVTVSAGTLPFSPRIGERIRVELNFKTREDARECFVNLTNGSMRIKDYADRVWDTRTLAYIG